MIHPSTIQQKTQGILEDVQLLEELKDVPIKKILSDPWQQHAFNDIVIKIVQRAVDINSHILQNIEPTTEFTSPHSYRDTFIVMGQAKIIPQKLAEAIADSGPLRNILAHTYEEIDPVKIDVGRQKMVELYPKYCQEILKWLQKNLT